MKNFEVSRLENSSYDYLVIATTYISPISTLDEVQKAFKNISGKILFNLTQPARSLPPLQAER